MPDLQTGEIQIVKIIRVQFTTAGKLYDFLTSETGLAVGDHVIVETERGRSIALVAAPPADIPDGASTEGMRQVVRKALPEELASGERYAAQEREARRYCMEKIRERKLEMKLVKCEYQYDGSKAIFYFTAEGRIDFRELVKDLAHHLRIRIEMRQIGVRDESKLVGGLGICGRELCCATFLREFAPVSVKMAKEQNLALNPAKISGQCGRLLCCLGYEHDTYLELKKGLPKCGKTISCGSNCSGEVIKQNLLRQTVTIRTDTQKELTLTRDDLARLSAETATVPPPSSERQMHETQKQTSDTPTEAVHHLSRQETKQQSVNQPEPNQQRRASRRRSRRHGKKGGQGGNPSAAGPQGGKETP